MVLTAIRGALGFLTRVPVGHDESAWNAFARTPVAFPIVGYLVGATLVLPLLVPGPAVTIAVLFVGTVYLVTGINHLDGVADVGDAAVVHGNATERRAVMTDTAVGVGGAFAVVLTVLALWAGAIGMLELSTRAIVLVVVAEVGAKTAVALCICFGSAPHEGLGSTFVDNATPRSAVPVALVAAGVVFLSWPRVIPSIAALSAAVLAGVTTLLWARRRFGGVSGDVLGATNELARIAALHVGVIAWTLW